MVEYGVAVVFDNPVHGINLPHNVFFWLNRIFLFESLVNWLIGVTKDSLECQNCFIEIIINSTNGV